MTRITGSIAIVALLWTSAAWAGIEEHSPDPQSLDFDYLFVDEDLWAAADEARRESQEEDMSPMGASHQEQAQAALEDALALKEKFAAYGLEYLTVDEWETIQDESHVNQCQGGNDSDPTLNSNVNGESNANTAACARAAESRDADEGDEDESRTASLESELQYEEEEAQDTQAIGCNGVAGIGGIAPFFFTLLALIRVRPTL